MPEFTDREILERLRAEFDYIFYRDRNSLGYAGFLEQLILNRLAETHLAPYSPQYGGVAQWDREPKRSAPTE